MHDDLGTGALGISEDQDLPIPSVIVCPGHCEHTGKPKDTTLTPLLCLRLGRLWPRIPWVTKP